MVLAGPFLWAHAEFSMCMIHLGPMYPFFLYWCKVRSGWNKHFICISDPKKCTFWGFRHKSGDFECHKSQKNCTALLNCKLVWNFLVLDCFGPFYGFWEPFWAIWSIVTTIKFGQYIVLHHLDDKNHISDRLGKQKFSILSSYGHLFWQFPQKCTFWDFWLKSGDFESKNLKIVHNTPYMGLFSKEIMSRFEIFGSFWVLDCFGPFRIFWRPFLGILSIMTTLNFGKYILLHHVDHQNHISNWLYRQYVSIFISFWHLFWSLIFKAQTCENELGIKIAQFRMRHSRFFFGNLLGQKNKI